MARAFPLAVLLGLRRLEQNEATMNLADANRRTGEIQNRRGAAIRDLHRSPVDVANSDALRMAAFARATSRSMFQDLAGLSELAEGDTIRAQEQFQAARAAALGLEKLKDKHVVRDIAEGLRAEQIAMDDIATRSWHERQASTTR